MDKRKIVGRLLRLLGLL